MYNETKLRANDLIFVLNQLGNDSAIADLIPSRGPHAFDNSRAMVFGHSLGGSTATQCLVQDARFVGGVNMDGPVYGRPLLPPLLFARSSLEDNKITTCIGDEPITQGINQPYLIFSSTLSPPRATEDWNATFAHAHVYKQGLTFDGALHNTLSDFPTILAAAGLDPTTPPWNATLGSVKPQRGIELMTRYFTALFELAWAADGSVPALLQGPSPGFPEVEFKANNVEVPPEAGMGLV